MHVRICGINRLHCASIFPICGINRVRSASIFLICQVTLDSRIGSLESIPGLLKRLQIRAQATLTSVIGSLESIPRLHNMKNEDEDVFFYRNGYIRPSTIKGTKKNKFIHT
jgi:hypothetical protein